MRAIRRMLDGIGHWSTDSTRARRGFSLSRSETGKTLRAVQSDVIAMQNQNIARHGETLNIMHRMRDAAARLDEVPA